MLPQEPEEGGEDHRQRQQPHPTIGQTHDQIFRAGGEGGQAGGEGGADPGGKAVRDLLHAGELVDLPEVDGDSGEVHQGVIAAQGAGEAFDLVFRLGDGGFDGDDILHDLRPAQQFLKPLQLDLLCPQAALRVVVGLRHVFRALGPPGQIAKLSGPEEEFVVPLRRNPDGVVRPAVAAAAGAEGAVLIVATHFLCQAAETFHGPVKGGGLHLQIGGADYFGVPQSIVSPLVQGGGLLVVAVLPLLRVHRCLRRPPLPCPQPRGRCWRSCRWRSCRPRRR